MLGDDALKEAFAWVLKRGGKLFFLNPYHLIETEDGVERVEIRKRPSDITLEDKIEGQMIVKAYTLVLEVPIGDGRRYAARVQFNTGEVLGLAIMNAVKLTKEGLRRDGEAFLRGLDI
jgi:hypothetical protein